MTISLISTTESTNFRNSTASKATPSISWNAGDIITVWGFTGDSTRTLTAPTGTGLTFTQQLASATTSRIKLYLWTATPGSSGSSVISSTLSNAENGGLVVKVWRGTGTLSLGTVSSLGSSTTGTPQVTYTVGATGSVVDGGWGNWNQNSAARTYRTTNLGTATEDDYYDNATFATVGTWHNAATTATGSQTVGLSSPTMNAWLLACIEIKETGGGGTPVSATRALSYSISAPVSATRAVTYAISVSVSATRALKYDIVQSVAATRALKYDIVQSVAATRAVVYAIATQVAATRALSYDILVSATHVSDTRALSYAIAAQVAATRALTYDIHLSVAATRALKYDLIAAVAATRALSYTINAPVTATRTLRYTIGVITTPSGDLMLTWLM